MKTGDLIIFGVLGIVAYIVLKGINLTGSPFGLFTNPRIVSPSGNITAVGCPTGQVMQYSIAGVPMGCGSGDIIS